MLSGPMAKNYLSGVEQLLKERLLLLLLCVSLPIGACSDRQALSMLIGLDTIGEFHLPPIHVLLWGLGVWTPGVVLECTCSHAKT